MKFFKTARGDLLTLKRCSFLHIVLWQVEGLTNPINTNSSSNHLRQKVIVGYKETREKKKKLCMGDTHAFAFNESCNQSLSA